MEAKAQAKREIAAKAEITAKTKATREAKAKGEAAAKTKYEAQTKVTESNVLAACATILVLNCMSKRAEFCVSR